MANSAAGPIGPCSRPRRDGNDEYPPEHAHRTSDFGIHMPGAVLTACALGYTAYLPGVSTAWVAIIVALLIGIGVMSGVLKTRKRDLF